MTLQTGPHLTTLDGVFIDNRWQAAASGKTLPLSDPATGAEFARIAAGTAEDVDRAVRAARRALSGAWGALTATARGRLLSRLAALIEGEADRLAALEMRDTGKPASQARGDIAAAARYFEFYGGAADKVGGHACGPPRHGPRHQHGLQPAPPARTCAARWCAPRHLRPPHDAGRGGGHCTVLGGRMAADPAHPRRQPMKQRHSPTAADP